MYLMHFLVLAVRPELGVGESFRGSGVASGWADGSIQVQLTATRKEKPKGTSPTGVTSSSSEPHVSDQVLRRTLVS